MSTNEAPSAYDVRSRLDWLCSYPKSGNTWVRLLLAAYMARTPVAVDFSADYGRLFFGAVSPVPVEKMTFGQQVQVRGAALFHAAAERLERPLILKSHNVYGSFYGLRLFSPQWTRKVVYVVRDPRDVLPSLAHHLGKDLEETADVMSDPRSRLPGRDRGAQHIASWSQHVRSWLGAREELDVLVVRYEDLHEDAGKQLERVLRHYGHLPGEVDRDKVEAAVEDASFDNVARREDEEEFPEASRHGRFFRKGESGGWREEVPPELVERIEFDHGEAMEMLGYETQVVGT